MIRKISSQEVVDIFLEFFESRGHTKIPGHLSKLEMRSVDTNLKRLLPVVEGRGGGKDTLAAGSGPNVSGVEALLEEARQLAQEHGAPTPLD